MWFIIIIAAIVIFWVIKIQLPKADGGDSPENVDEVIKNSEAARVFADDMCMRFNEDGECFQWLMANSKERMFQLSFTKQGILLKKVEVNRHRLKETGTYDVESAGIGFGASGYQDLPSSKYVYSFRQHILSEMRNNCPHITITDDDYVKLRETAKKSW